MSTRLKPNREALILILILEISVFSLITCVKNNNKAIDAAMIGREVVCPVTKEKFKITKNTRFVDYQGRRYYFCCPGCDKEFLKNPEKYIKKMGEENTVENKDSLTITDSIQSPATNKKILYWTCSMHPAVRSDKPGDCPICGMDLIPIYEGNEGKININDEYQKTIGIISAPAIERDIIKTISIPVKVARDEELYNLVQDYISAQNINGNLLVSSKTRLKLLGFSEANMKDILINGKPDPSLLNPSPHRVWLFLEIYEQDIGLVKPGMDVWIKFSGLANRIFKGNVISIEQTIDSLSRRMRARALIKHPEFVLPINMFGEARVDIHLGKHLAVPYSSIIDTGIRKVVYVETQDNIFEMRNIETGYETDEYVQVVNGLKEGERVVVQGNFLLDSQSTLSGGQSLLYGAAEEIKETPESQHRH